MPGGDESGSRTDTQKAYFEACIKARNDLLLETYRQVDVRRVTRVLQRVLTVRKEAVGMSPRANPDDGGHIIPPRNDLYADLKQFSVIKADSIK